MIRPVAHAAVDFGCQHRFLTSPAALRKPAADDLLRPAFARFPAIGIGGVKEINAKLERLVHDRKRIFLRGLRTKVHGAKTQTGHLEPRAAQLGVFHFFLQKLILQNSHATYNGRQDQLFKSSAVSSICFKMRGTCPSVRSGCRIVSNMSRKPSSSITRTNRQEASWGVV